MRYAILCNGVIKVRALPTRRAAERLNWPNGKVIIDPRSVQR